MVPFGDPPSTDQVTVVSSAPATWAVKGWVWPSWAAAVAGLTVTLTTGPVTTSQTEAPFVVSARLAARTDTEAGSGTAGGAV